VPKNWHIERLDSLSTPKVVEAHVVGSEQDLSRRERQLMDALFQTGEATAAEVLERMPDPPSYTAVRTMLRILEDKGLIEHRSEGRRYVYKPRLSSRLEGRSAFQRVLRVFFGGSLEQALAAHLSDPNTRLDEKELKRMQALIDELGASESSPRRSKKETKP
jgi:BlaI family transcriptional regulator, penicillinase repressor